MAVLSFSRLVQNSPSSRVGFPSPQFQPTGPIPAVKSGRIPVTTVSADWSNTCRQVGSDSRHHSFSRLVQYLPSSRVGFPSPQFSADWSNTCRQVGSDSRHHSFSRLVQYLPSSRVGFRRTDGPKYFSSHLMAGSQFQPTGPKLAFKSGRIPTDGRTDGPTFFVQSPDGSSQFQPTGPKLAFKSGRIPTDGRTDQHFLSGHLMAVLSFSRLVQNSPSSRVGFRRTDGRTDQHFWSSHLMAVLSFSRLVQNSPSSRVGFQSTQFKPTGPKPAVKSGRIPMVWKE